MSALPDLPDLARQIAALPGWEWRPGMRAVYPSGRGIHIQALDGPSGVCGVPPVACIPDLTDPATAGAMLAVLAEAGLEVDVARMDSIWAATITLSHTTWITRHGATMGEAIARLILARGGWR